MKMQLLKRTVNSESTAIYIIIVIPREKDNMHNTPTGFRGAFKVKHFASFLRKYEIRPQKNKCKHIVSNGFL